jgi:hypothetical protein
MIDIYQKTAFQKERCEDYVSNIDNNMIILADGCSSSKNSHLGALLYSEVGYKYLQSRKRMDSPNWEALAHICSATLEKKGTSYLDATCLVLKEEKNDIRVSIIGDGLLFFKKKEDEFPTFIEYSYSENTPMYPSYLIDNKRKELYDESTKDQKYIAKWFNIEGEEVEEFQECNFPNKFFRKENLEYVGIASDGIFDFRKNGKVIDPQIVLRHITGFKGSGEFLSRRMSFMIKQFTKENIFPHDDFSIGVWKNDNI